MRGYCPCQGVTTVIRIAQQLLVLCEIHYSHHDQRAPLLAAFNARDAKLDWVITVAKTGQPGPWTDCAVPRGTRTIVMISHRG